MCTSSSLRSASVSDWAIVLLGKPQTTAWQCRRPGFALNNLRAIWQLSDFDFQKNLDLFQGGAEGGRPAAAFWLDRDNARGSKK
jgi:hypothetical protein